jgi:hypothetical protein
MAGEYDDLIPSGSAPVTTSAPQSPAVPQGGGYDDLIPKTPPPSINAPPPSSTGNSFWYDVIHPQAADLSRPQTWRDWATKTYYPTAADYGRAALDDVSMGTADYAQSKLYGGDLDQIRARTAASQAALGPMGPVVNALTYILPTGGAAKAVLTPGKYIAKAAPVIGRVGAAAGEGAVASGLSSAGHQLGSNETWGDLGENVAADATKGAAFGAGGHYVGSGLTNVADIPAVRRVADFINSNPGRASDPYFGAIRAHSNIGADVSQDIQNIRSSLPPGAPAEPGLKAAQDAASQSIEPGLAGKTAMSAADFAARAAGSHVIGPFAWVMRGPAEWASQKVGNAVTAINQHARNQAIQAGLDQAVRDAAPPATGWGGGTGWGGLNRSRNRFTVNTSGFPDAWTQYGAGGARQPLANPPAGPLAHW